MPRAFMRSLFALFVTWSLASAQDAPQPATLETLLKEVHALRIAMERSNQIAPKVQIALARMQVQEERVRNANRQLQDARNRIRDFENKQADISDRIKQTETQQAQAVDPNTRKQMDLEIQALKAELAQFSKLEQQAQAQEAEANSQLLNEQTKWNEVNDLLTGIERMLAPVQP
jgi:predicted  nucleic acid-binding Zn-ribbon protein